MNPSYHFAARAAWINDRCGVVTANPGSPDIVFSAPPEFHGEPGLWTPEHFLLASAASCFVTTLRAIAELSKFDVAKLEVGIEGTVEKQEGGFRFTRILLRPALTINSEADRERALRLIGKAESACLIARSLRSEVVFEPKVTAIAAAA